MQYYIGILFTIVENGTCARDWSTSSYYTTKRKNTFTYKMKNIPHHRYNKAFSVVPFRILK